MPDNNFITLNQVNSVEFDSAHLWDIRFPDAPAPFNEFFPCKTFDCDIYNIQSNSYNLGNIQVSIPAGFMTLTCRVDTYDAADGRLANFLRQWTSEEMLKKSGDYIGMNYLEEYCKTMYVRKLNYQHEIMREDEYTVSPEGSFRDTGNEEPTEKILSFELRIQYLRNISINPSIPKGTF